MSLAGRFCQDHHVGVFMVNGIENQTPSRTFATDIPKEHTNGRTCSFRPTGSSLIPTFAFRRHHWISTGSSASIQSAGRTAASDNGLPRASRGCARACRQWISVVPCGEASPAAMVFRLRKTSFRDTACRRQAVQPTAHNVDRKAIRAAPDVSPMEINT